jgi:succinate-acetate transporter protein
MALMSLGWMLEVQLGTLHMMFTTIVLTFLSSFIHLLIVFVLLDLVKWTAAAQYLNACGVGYSGILFAYMILSAHYGPVNQSL